MKKWLLLLGAITSTEIGCEKANSFWKKNIDNFPENFGHKWNAIVSSSKARSGYHAVEPSIYITTSWIKEIVHVKFLTFSTSDELVQARAEVRALEKLKNIGAAMKIKACCEGKDFVAIIFEPWKINYYSMFMFFQTLSLLEKVDIFIQSAKVLERVHKSGVVHGNIDEYAFIFQINNLKKTRIVNFEHGGRAGSAITKPLSFTKAPEFFGADNDLKVHSFAEDVWDFYVLWKQMFNVQIPVEMYVNVSPGSINYSALKLENYLKVKMERAADLKIELPESEVMMSWQIARGLEPDPKKRHTMTEVIKRLEFMKREIIKQKTIKHRTWEGPEEENNI